MKKSGHYRRAAWLTDQPRNFGALIEECLEFFEDEPLPRFVLNTNEECLIARKSFFEGRRYLHLVVFEAGAPAAVIQTMLEEGANEIDAGEQVPDEGQEYIKSQIYCVIENNNIVWATHNSPMRENTILKIFFNLIEAAELGGNPSNTQFMFQVIVDENHIRELLRNGIQQIDLGLGAFRSTLEQIVNDGQLPNEGFMGMIANMFTGMPTAEQIEAASQVEGKLVLKPGRSWDQPEVIDFLSAASQNIREEYPEEFAIVTKKGFRLTRDRMSLQRPFDVAGNKRVLTSLQVDAELRAIFAALEEDGLLDG